MESQQESLTYDWEKETVRQLEVRAFYSVR